LAVLGWGPAGGGKIFATSGPETRVRSRFAAPSPFAAARKSSPFAPDSTTGDAPPRLPALPSGGSGRLWPSERSPTLESLTSAQRTFRPPPALWPRKPTVLRENGARRPDQQGATASRQEWLKPCSKRSGTHRREGCTLQPAAQQRSNANGSPQPCPLPTLPERSN